MPIITAKQARQISDTNSGSPNFHRVMREVDIQANLGHYRAYLERCSLTLDDVVHLEDMGYSVYGIEDIEVRW